MSLVHTQSMLSIVFLVINVTFWVLPLIRGVAKEDKARNMHAALLDISTDIPLFIINVLGKGYKEHAFIAISILWNIFQFAKAISFGLVYENRLAGVAKKMDMAILYWISFVIMYWFGFATYSLVHDSQDPLTGLLVFSIAMCILLACAAYHMKDVHETSGIILILICFASS